MKDLYFGEGIHDLEYDGQNFRWASDDFYLYTYNKNIKELRIKIYSVVEGNVQVLFNNKHLILNLNIGHNYLNIFLPEYSEKIQIKQPFLIPSEKFKSNDTRKLSYRIYEITTLNNTDESSVYDISNISYINDIALKFIKKDNLFKNEDVSIETIGRHGDILVNIIKNNESGKINLKNEQICFYYHRSGWHNIIDNLKEFHNENGVIFDGFIEKTFCWKRRISIKNNIIPYKKNWIGFLHNPPNMPPWFSEDNSYLQSIINDSFFIESLPYCKGLFVLSDYMKRYIQYYIPNIPVEMLYFSTEIPEIKFDFNKFLKNDEKKIVNVGWWLRKLNSIFLLDAPNKIRLMPGRSCKDTINKLSYIERKLFNLNLTEEQISSVKIIDFIDNCDYDELLSKNLVFLDLYDTSANNVIVECIARGTPLLVNKHVAVVEYLGEDYPFYFDSLKEASEKSKDISLIEKTNHYLMNFNNREKITIEYFKKQFINSNVYKSL